MLAPRDGSLTTEWRPLAELGGIADDWRALARRAVEPNCFYEPAFALAAAPVLGADAGVRRAPPRPARAAGPRRLSRRQPWAQETQGAAAPAPAARRDRRRRVHVCRGAGRGGARHGGFLCARGAGLEGRGRHRRRAD